MKIEIVYYELKYKEFRSKKTLSKFLKSKLDSEILRVLEVKKGVHYAKEMRAFLHEYKY